MFWLFRDEEAHRKLNNILTVLMQIRTQGDQMTAALQELKDKVTALKGAVDSTKALLDWLVGQIKNADTLEDIQAIGADVAAETQVLADAVAANPIPVVPPVE